MLRSIIKVIVGLPVAFLIYHTLIRIVRHFYKFPIPEFLAGAIDNPLRRRLQPPDETAVRHGIRPGMTVLEVGPGNGTYTMAAARRIGPAGRLVAVDIEPKIIQRVRRRVQQEGVDNVEAHLASVYDLPYRDHTFDLITLIAVIGEIPEPERAVAEFHRVAKPSGSLVFSELLFDPDYPLRRTIQRWAKAAGFQMRQCLGNALYYTLVFRKDSTSTYKSVIVTRTGPPEVLQVIENDLRTPSKGEVRIKTLAAAVCRPDITVRTGESLYSGTPLGQKVPFVPGYAIIGIVDALGEGVGEVAVGDRVGALTVTGGYAEYVYWRSNRLIPVPTAVDPAEAVTLVLNYLVAYQVLHRSAKVSAGDRTLIIGASGGIGTALLQLGKLAGLTMYGIASKSKHGIITEMGAIPIDYHTQDFVQVIRQAEPEGLDAVIDGMMRMYYIKSGLSLLRRGGRLVSYGEPSGLGALVRILATLIAVNLLPNGISFKLYGTSSYFLFDRRPYVEDWATLFKLLEEHKIEPIIMQKFPIVEAAKANALLESGKVVGNVVLVAPGEPNAGET